MSKGSIVCSDNIEVAWKTCNNVTGKYGKEKFQNAHIGGGGGKSFAQFPLSRTCVHPPKS